ncbi:aspartate-semialdehyde dehydrogenase [Gudongella sp. DL1XJH-153]|uniref:aspartate-semialdehyde dehydrogenase n=1 Tax=Gudongella sp. DL1XJH-153 TaxID=3409804 RepID=UPI003BB5AE20
MKKFNVAVVGATGLVGRTILQVLQEKDFPVQNLYLIASERSEGEIVQFKDKEYKVIKISEEAFDKEIDIAFFAAGGAVSEKYAPIAAEKGIQVVDNSSVFRMNPGVPLVVPEVNPEDIKNSKGIIANPNCSTIQCMLPLKALQDAYGIERVVYSTYQSVSGSGTKGLRDLDKGLAEFYPYPINGNVLPHIDVFLDNGYTKEEMKMIQETRKILHDDEMKITATTVRVPVRFAHSVSANIQLKRKFDINVVRKILQGYPGIIVKDDPEKAEYPIPQDAEGKDEVYVGRIRRDFSQENGLNLWIVADNIRKGAATNAVQIGELLVNNWEEKE